MDTKQKLQYKNNYIDNKTLEFICQYGKEPSVTTMKKWGKEADAKLREMANNLKKWS